MAKTDYDFPATKQWIKELTKRMPKYYTDSTLTTGTITVDSSGSSASWEAPNATTWTIDTSGPSGDPAMDAPALANLLRQSEGSGARLEIGRYLHRYHRDGRQLQDVRQQLLSTEGVSLPSDSRCSIYRKAYEAWMARPLKSRIMTEDGALKDGEEWPVFQVTSPYSNIQLNDDTMVKLADFSVDKLYLVRKALDTEPAEDVLTWIRDHNEGELRAMLKNGGGIDEEEPDRPIATSNVATLKLPRSLYEQLQDFVDRLRTVTGQHDLSWGAALEFMMGQFSPDDIPDATLDFLWRQAHGELTREEVEELEREYYTVS